MCTQTTLSNLSGLVFALSRVTSNPSCCSSSFKSDSTVRLYFFFPSGLVLYCLVYNLLSILQQWRINHVIGQAGHGKPAKK